MPLDISGYGSSDYEAMLIVSPLLAEHIENGQSIKRLWIDVAAKLFCEKLEILPHQLYITTASEVTKGHLSNHKGKVCVLGSQEDSDTLETNTQVCLKNIGGDFIYHPSDTYLVFPQTAEDMIREDYLFDAVVIANANFMFLCEVDLKQSRATSSIILHRPSEMCRLLPIG